MYVCMMLETERVTVFEFVKKFVMCVQTFHLYKNALTNNYYLKKANELNEKDKSMPFLYQLPWL